MSELSRISLTIPEELLSRLNQIIRAEGYASRSEALRDAVLDFIAEREWRRGLKGTQTGIIVMVYDHEVRGLADRLIDIQHEVGEAVAASMHWHLDEHNCLEVLLVRGPAKLLTSLAEKLESLRGVKLLKLVPVGK